MKFEFCPELIIGTILILWGASIIIKLLTGVDIPVLKPLLAIFLIYLGLNLLFGPRWSAYCKRTIYTYTINEDEEKDTK